MKTKSCFYIVILSLWSFFLQSISGCQYAAKQSLIRRAEGNDINAMLELNECCFFVDTKEGLAYYKKWYFNVLEVQDGKQVFSFAEMLNKHSDLFVNGEVKYLTLLHRAKQLGSVDALYALLEYYHDNMLGDDDMKTRFAEIKAIILTDKSESNLLRLKKSFTNMSAWDDSKKLRVFMEEKGYLDSSLTNIKELDEAYRKSKYIGYDKNRLPNIINKILDSNSVDDIYYASKKIKHREHDFREILLRKVLQLTNDNKLKGDVYFDLADNQTKRKEHLFEVKKYYLSKLGKEKNRSEKISIEAKIAELDKEREEINLASIIELYEKASSFGHFSALKELYFIYNKHIFDYNKSYHAVVDKLKETDVGLKFYLEHNPYDIELFQILAEKGDKDIIVKLAKQNLLDERPEFEPVAEKYRAVVLASDDYELHLKMKDILKSYSYKYSDKAKYFLTDLEEKEADWQNIYVLRSKIESLCNSSDIAACNKSLQQAYLYGDVKNTLRLAGRYVAAGYVWEYEDNKSEAKKEVLQGIDIYEQLASQGEKQAIKQLADIYSSAVFMDKERYNLTKAISYYEKLSQLGDHSGLKKIIKLYECESCGLYNESEFVKRLEFAWEKTNKPYYAKKLAMLYYRKGDKENLKKAAHFFELSESYYFLAKLYYDQDGLGIDPKKSYAYLQKCASLEFESDNCNYLMGMFYKKGFAVDKDNEKAKAYFSFSSYNKYANPPLSALELTKLYEEDHEYKKAIEVYFRLATYYKKEALIHLNRLQKAGYVTQSQLEALHDHLLTDYRLGFSQYDKENAALCISYMYENGLGVQKDMHAAKSWYEKHIN